MRPELLAIVLIAGCASPPPVANAPPLALAGLTPGETRSCLATTPSQSLAILDHGVVGYQIGRTTWVNKLPVQCSGLHPLNTLVVEAQGSQICRGDRIRVIQHPLTAPGPSCVLGNFTAYRRG